MDARSAPTIVFFTKLFNTLYSHFFLIITQDYLQLKQNLQAITKYFVPILKFELPILLINFKTVLVITLLNFLMNFI